MTIRYEVKNKTVYAWNDELVQSEPFLYQPHHPDGTPFASDEEAQAWADAWYLEFTTPVMPDKAE